MPNVAKISKKSMVSCRNNILYYCSPGQLGGHPKRVSQSARKRKPPEIRPPSRVFASHIAQNNRVKITSSTRDSLKQKQIRHSSSRSSYDEDQLNLKGKPFDPSKDDVPRLSNLVEDNYSLDQPKELGAVTREHVKSVNEVFGESHSGESTLARDYTLPEIYRQHMEEAEYKKSRIKYMNEIDIIATQMKPVQLHELPGFSETLTFSKILQLTAPPTLAEQEQPKGFFRSSRLANQYQGTTATQGISISLREYIGALINFTINNTKSYSRIFKDEFPLKRMAQGLPKTPTSAEQRQIEKEQKEEAGVKFAHVTTTPVPGDSWLATLLHSHNQAFEHYMKDVVPEMLYWKPKVEPNMEQVEPPWHYKLAVLLQHWINLLTEIVERDEVRDKANQTIKSEYFRKIHIPFEPINPRMPWKRWLIKKLGYEHLNRYRATGAHELADWIEDVGQLYDPEREMYRAFAPRRKTPREAIEIPVLSLKEAVDVINKLEKLEDDRNRQEALKQKNIDQYYKEQDEKKRIEEQKRLEAEQERLREEEELQRLLDESLNESQDIAPIDPEQEDASPERGEGEEEEGIAKEETEEEEEKEPEEKPQEEEKKATDWFSGDDDDDDDMLSIDNDALFDDEEFGEAEAEEAKEPEEPNPFGWTPDLGTGMVALESPEEKMEDIDESLPDKPRLAYMNSKGEYVVREKVSWENLKPYKPHGKLGEGEGSLGEEAAAQMMYFWDELRETDPYFNLQIIKWEMSHFTIPKLWAALFGYQWKNLHLIASEQFCKEAIPILQREAFERRHFVNKSELNFIPDPQTDVRIPSRKGITVGTDRRSPAMKVDFDLHSQICWMDPVWGTIVEGDKHMLVESLWSVELNYNKTKRKWEVHSVEFKTLPAQVSEGSHLQEGYHWKCPKNPIPAQKRSQLFEDFQLHLDTADNLMSKGMWATDEEAERRRQFLHQRREWTHLIRDPPELNFWHHKHKYQPWQRNLRLQQYLDDPKVPPEENPGNKPITDKQPWELPIKAPFQDPYRDYN